MFPTLRTIRPYLGLMLLLGALLEARPVRAVPSWVTYWSDSVPNSISNMMLMSDGSVLIIGQSGLNYRLTPDAHGSYANPTMTELASSRYTMLDFGAQVLQSGKVFTVGAEVGSGANQGESYDPILNKWTLAAPALLGGVYDCPTALLPNGKVLVGSDAGSGTEIYDPATDSQVLGPNKRNPKCDEENWVKLGDQTVLCVDFGGYAGQWAADRYSQSQNQFIDGGVLPFCPWDINGEMGPTLRLADGRAFIKDGTGATAFYTPPSDPLQSGTWAAGPYMVVDGNLYGAPDCAGVTEPNGKILVYLGQPNTYNGPAVMAEYDPVANTFSSMTAGGGFISWTRFLPLPDGSILWGNTQALGIIAPDSGPLAAAQPGITSISQNTDGSFHLTGTNINGIWEGGEMGDDAQMSSNYPVVQFTSGSNVWYARSYNWSSTCVATGTTPETTEFTLPLGLTSGTYSVKVVANGVPSPAVSLTLPTVPGDVAPTVATAAAATSGSIATQMNLSVLGASGSGESTLTYTWVTTSSPSLWLNVPSPSYSANGTNAAKNTTVQFYALGSYSFKVYITDTAGLSATSSVNVTVTDIPTLDVVSPVVSPNLTSGQAQQFTAVQYNQFGALVSPQPTFTWSVPSGCCTFSSTGLYTSPVGTQATVTAVSGSLSAGATADVVDAPWASTDVGSPGIAGSAYDVSGTFYPEWRGE